MSFGCLSRLLSKSMDDSEKMSDCLNPGLFFLGKAGCSSKKLQVFDFVADGLWWSVLDALFAQSSLSPFFYTGHNAPLVQLSGIVPPPNLAHRFSTARLWLSPNRPPCCQSDVVESVPSTSSSFGLCYLYLLYVVLVFLWMAFALRAFSSPFNFLHSSSNWASVARRSGNDRSGLEVDSFVHEIHALDHHLSATSKIVQSDRRFVCIFMQAAWLIFGLCTVYLSKFFCPLVGTLLVYLQFIEIPYWPFKVCNQDPTCH